MIYLRTYFYAFIYRRSVDITISQQAEEYFRTAVILILCSTTILIKQNCGLFYGQTSLQDPNISDAILAPASQVNLLKTKRNLLYIRNQFVPGSKHFPPRL